MGPTILPRAKLKPWGLILVATTVTIVWIAISSWLLAHGVVAAYASSPWLVVLAHTSAVGSIVALWWSAFRSWALNADLPDARQCEHIVHNAPDAMLLVDAAGVIQEKSRWMKGEQMQLLGYEDTFNRDLNKDEIIGEPPVIDADGDGLIDGSSVYRILKDDQGIILTNSRGRALSSQSSRYWDVVKVVAADNGFEVLVEGESYLVGRHQVWSVDVDGMISEKSRWMTLDQMLALGYEDVFNRDFNGDGLTAVVTASLD